MRMPVSSGTLCGQSLFEERTGSTNTPFRFVGTLGYYRDATARLYVRARTYLANYARWLTVDPLRPSESAYGYAQNNPIMVADWTGMTPSIIGIVLIAGAICAYVDVMAALGLITPEQACETCSDAVAAGLLSLGISLVPFSVVTLIGIMNTPPYSKPPLLPLLKKLLQLLWDKPWCHPRQPIPGNGAVVQVGQRQFLLYRPILVQIHQAVSRTRVDLAVCGVSA